MKRLEDCARVVLCRSDRLLYELIQSGKKTKPPDDSKYKRELLRRLITDIAPGQHMLESHFHAFQLTGVSEQTILNYNLDFMGDVFANYFRINNMAIESTKTRASASRDIIDKVHPFTFISYKLAQLLHSEEVDLHTALSIAKNCQESGAGTTKPINPMLADIHVHLGGVQQAAYLIVALMFLDTLPTNMADKNFMESVPIPPEFTLLRAGKITIVQVLQILRVTFRMLGQSHEHYAHLLQHGEDFFRIPFWKIEHSCIQGFQPVSSTERNWQHSHCNNIFNELTREMTIAYREGHLVYAALLIHIRVQLILLNTTDVNERRVALLFLQSFNIMRSTVVMGSHSGLGHFIRYFNSPFRKLQRISGVTARIVSGECEYRSRAIFQSGTKAVNFRVTPDLLTDEDSILPSMIRSIDASVLECIAKPKSGEAHPFSDSLLPVYQMLETNTDSTRPCYQLTLHYLRTVKDGQEIHPVNRQKRNEVYNGTLLLDKWLHASSTRNRPIETLPGDWFQKNNAVLTLRNTNIGNYRIDLSKLVVGIDIAGSESSGYPVEMFSPAILFLRRDFSEAIHMDVGRHSRLKTKPQKRLPAHIHAGEDFSHLVTGMRAIDETIRFCEYGEGDRIGHGLAMGFNPEKWFADHSNITIKLEQAFDNYVWLHLNVQQADFSHLQKNDVLSFLKHRIEDLAEQLYGKNLASQYTIGEWQQAWRLRGLCPFSLIEYATSHNYGEVNTPIGKVSIAKAKRLMRQVGSTYSRVGQEDKTHQSSSRNLKTWLMRFVPLIRKRLFDKAWRKQANSLSYMNYNPACLRIDLPMSEIGALELLAIHIAQDYCLGQYALRKLTIEACPTSNFSIARFENYAEHPIFRWSPLDLDQLKAGAVHNLYGLRRGRVSVGVATDDPGVFSTTLDEEYEHLEWAAKHHYNCDADVTRQWIEMLKLTSSKCYNYAR